MVIVTNETINVIADSFAHLVINFELAHLLMIVMDFYPHPQAHSSQAEFF
jgi:hypothetical protein